jgi:hypothetical protein
METVDPTPNSKLASKIPSCSTFLKKQGQSKERNGRSQEEKKCWHS